MDNQKNQTIGYIKIYKQNILPGAVSPRHLVVPVNPKNGDLYYSNGTNFVKLAPGTTGQVLTNTDGVPAWNFLLTTGVAADKPNSGSFIGAQYYATDTFVLSIWNGSVWKSTTLA